MTFSFSIKSSTIYCTKFRVLNKKTEKAVRVSKQTLQKNFQISKYQILVKSSSSLVLTYNWLPLCNHTAKCKNSKKSCNVRPNIDVILTGEFVVSLKFFEIYVLLTYVFT